MTQFTQTYLALGSNISPRKNTINKCINALKESFTKDFKSSSLYQTAPFQNSKQKQYINCCVRFKTNLTAQQLLKQILELELALGRIRTEIKWDNRTIDIDIILFGKQIIQSPTLTVPHYDLSNRDFFLIPLMELAPDMLNPKSGLLLKNELLSLNKDLKTYPEII